MQEEDVIEKAVTFVTCGMERLTIELLDFFAEIFQNYGN